MSCNNCGNISRTCGCTDTPYTTNVPTICVPACPPKCAEYINSRCALLSDGLDLIKAIPGESIEQTIQRLLLYISTPLCVGKATSYVYTTTLLPTSITVNWEAVVGSLNYQVEYKLNDPLVIVWSTLPTQLTTTATITGLLNTTSYQIRIKTTAQNLTTCNSVIIVNSTL